MRKPPAVYAAPASPRSPLPSAALDTTLWALPSELDHPQADRRALRRLLRQRRRQLPPAIRLQAEDALLRQLKRLPELLRARHVALYLPYDGEIDATRLCDWLQRRGAKVYLPVLRPFAANSLWFVRYDDQTPLVSNRFGIAEPDTRHGASRVRRLPAWALDVVLMPLVGFDGHGARIGMGGGFYDRSFAFTRRPGPRPLLIGLAHHCQKVPALPVQPWDVPLDAIVSDREVVRPARPE